MRIIAGQRRGKRLFTPLNRSIRPTSDRLREAIFNILGTLSPGTVVLDLFAGTGAMGIEALSRGAAAAWFIDQSAAAVNLIQRNIDACDFSRQARVVRWDACRDPSPQIGLPACDLIFMDPPYAQGLLAPALACWTRSAVLPPQAILVLEHAVQEVLPLLAPSWRAVDQRRYGKSLVSFLRRML